MSKKAVLVMDMPENCLKCPLRDLYNDDCRAQSKAANETADTWEQLRSTCPLREMPEKMKPWGEGVYEQGWNDCIDAIGGGGE